MSSVWLSSSFLFLGSIALGRRFMHRHEQAERCKSPCATEKRGDEGDSSQETRLPVDSQAEDVVAISEGEGGFRSDDRQKNTKTTDAKSGRLTLQDELVEGTLTVQCIGTVQSIYRLCVGTPRQGLLAPHARGRIVLDRLDVGAGRDAVDGLEGYSHIWIVFVFHLNTVQKNKKRASSSKIAPPALGGQKVGVLATRSPHRFNPVGITLARLDGIRTIRRPESKNSCKGKSSSMVCLDISGLDLVEGTPILDVKPYVGTYDSPLVNEDVRVPSWVAGGLATKRTVSISEQARGELRTIVRQSALEFYGGSTSEEQQQYNESPEDAYENVSKCIEEVLAIDVRSAYQTTKARQVKSQAERAERLSNIVKTPSGKEQQQQQSSTTTCSCTQQIDNLLVHFDVKQTFDAQNAASWGSGAEDHVVVTSIQAIQAKRKT